MSKATELANAEATRAEASEPETEPTAPTEPVAPVEPTPAPDEPSTDEEVEEAEQAETPEQGEQPSAAALPADSLTISEELGRKRDKQRSAQAENIVKLGNEFEQDVAACPVCENAELAGLLVDRIRAIPAEAWAQIPVMFGVEVEPEHRMAEGVVMCDRCNGWGDLDYPTRNPHMKRQSCPKCASNGYVPDQQAEQPAAPVFTFPAPSPTPTVPTFAGGTADQWGRPPGHPHWGLDPAAVMP